MTRASGIALLATGIVTGGIGVFTPDPVGLDFSRLFTRNPTAEAMSLTMAGIASVVLGCLRGLRQPAR